MSFIDAVKGFVNGSEDTENYEEGHSSFQESEHTVPPTSVNEHVADITPGELYSIDTIAPQDFNIDAKKIGDSFKEGKTIFMNLSHCPDAIKQRIIDFSYGLAFAYEGKVTPNDDAIFLLTHPTVEINSLDEEK